MFLNSVNIKFKFNKYTGYCFVLPAVVYMLVFIGYPTVYNWIISFQEVTARTLGNNVYKLIGFSNFNEIFKDHSFWRSMRNTFYYTVWCLVFQFSLGFVFALFFQKQFILSKPLRGFIVISWILPITVTALTFKFMFAQDNGIINRVLLYFGFINKPVGWLIHGKTAMWALIIANSWIGIPFDMLLLVTGLNNIPKEIYEAAAIDGTSAMQRFIKITVPMLKPTIMSVLTLGFVYTFKVFDLVYVMTDGGPVDATEVLSTYSYKLSFQMFHFGTGAAAANILFICLLAIALLYIKTISRDEVI
jgi:multiple sugar transport system permease protein